MPEAADLPLAQRNEPQRVAARIAWAADRRHGVLTTAHLLELGLSRSAISRWADAGRLFRCYKGVYAVGRARLTQAGEWRAALDAVGGDARISHDSAVEFLEWRRSFSRPIHVTTSRRGVRQRRGLRIHVAPGDGPVVTRDGLRVTSPARTLADMAALVDDKALMRLCSAAAFKRQFDRGELLSLLGRGRPGAARLRRVLATLDVGGGVTRTELEHAFRRLIQRHRITPPRFNHELWAAGRKLVPDAAWMEHRFVIELDSRLGHGDEVSLFNDGEKDLIYEEIGLRCLRLTWRHVVRQEARTARALIARVGSC